MRNVRNVAIIVAIALAVYYVPGGGRTASTVEAALWVAFGLAICFIVLRVYRERRLSLASLGDRGRGLLYLVGGLILFLYQSSWWVNAHGLRELGWFVLAGFGIWAAVEVYRRSRTY